MKHLLKIFAVLSLAISSAYAATAAAAVPAVASATTAAATTGGAATPAGSGQSFMSLLPMLAVLILFMYFMVIRPQNKRAKEHRTLVGGIQKGDEILTVGGIIGRVEKIGDSFVVLSIADDVNVSIQKNAVASTLPKGTMKSI
jgi:preprotein translocase subunit YajC